MYISEIAPLNLRGGLGTVNQLGVTVGILFSQILGIQEILGTESGWPLLLGKTKTFILPRGCNILTFVYAGLAICPAILQLILFSFCPESPRYLLITANREEEARTGKICGLIIFEVGAYTTNYMVDSFWLFCAIAMKRLRASSQIEEDMEEMRVEGKSLLYKFQLFIQYS